MASNSIKVFIKVRPLIAREQNENAASVWQIAGNTLKSTDKQYEMTFDEIYDDTRSTQDLFEVLAKPIVTSALRGINGTIFAYGQTSSGKTYTMMGDETTPGIIPLTVREIFEQIENSDDRTFLLRIGYIEIYNEKIFDLLDEKKAECTKIHEPTPGEVNVNQRELVANSEEQIINYYERGNKVRRTGETNMNERSSRSHTIFRIWIESRVVGSPDEDATQVSHISLVDLAGSERANQTRAEGDRLKEGGHINKSLLSLGNVIRLLSDDAVPSYINYRDSKLTRILSASLGGNSMTSIICTITPAALDETFSTLVFAQNAKKIKNEPKVNEVMSDTVLMRRMQKEIQSLKNELDSEKSRNTELQQIQSLKDQIQEREGQFLHSHNMTVHHKQIDVHRRRTWAPSTHDVVAPKPLPPLTRLKLIPPFLVPTSFRDAAEVERLSDEFDDEHFMPGEQMNLDRTLSPGERTTEALSGLILTPREMKRLTHLEDSPNPLKLSTNEGLQARIKFLEEEIQELNDFKKVENSVGEDHKKLVGKLNYANDHIASLELKIEELQRQLAEKDCGVQVKNAIAERDKASKEKTEVLNILSSVEYEHELFRERARKREAELVKTLDEARDDSKIDALNATIANLKDKLKASEERLLHSSLKQPELKDIDMGAGGDSVVVDKIDELESKLKLAIDELDKVKQGLHVKKNEHSQVLNEYNEVSSQLVEALEDNDKLTEKVKNLEATAVAAEKCQILGDLVNSILNEEDPPAFEAFEDDETVQAMMLLREGYVMMKNNDSMTLEMQVALGSLQTENLQLKSKLYPIHESASETENELKDQVDSLALELNQTNAMLENETAKQNEHEETIEKLKEEIEAANKHNAGLEATIDAIAAAEAMDNEIKEWNSSANDVIRKLKDDLEAATKRNDDLKSKMTTLEAENASQLESIQSKADDIAKLAEELQSQLAASTDRQAQFASDIDNMTKDIDEKVSKISELEDAMTSQEAELSSEIAELKSGLQSLLALGEENVRLKQVEKDHKRMVNELIQKMSEIETRSAEVQAGVGLADIQTQRIHELELNEANLKKKFDDLEAELAELTEANECLHTENEMLVEKIEVLKQADEEHLEIKEQNIDFDLKIHELQYEVADLQQQLAEKSEGSVSTSVNTIAEFETLAQSALVEQQLSEALEKVNQMTEITSELERLQDELKQSQQALAKLSSIERDAEAQKQLLIEAQKKITELEAEFGNKPAEDTANNDSKIENNDSKIENEDLKETEELKKLTEQLKKLTEELKNETDELKNEIDDLKKTIESLTSDNVEVTKKLDDVQRQLETKEASINILESCLKDKNQEIEELARAANSSMTNSKEVDNLKKQLADSEEELSQLKETVAAFDATKSELTMLKVEKLTLDEEHEALLEKSKELIYDCNMAKEKFKKLEQSNAKIDAEFTNLQSKLVIADEERKILERSLKEKTDECIEIQQKVKRRSLDTDKKTQQFELQKQELTQQIGALEAQKLLAEQQVSKVLVENESLKNLASDTVIKHELALEMCKQLNSDYDCTKAQKAALDLELRKIKTELTKLSELQMENDRLKVESSDNDVKFTMLDEKHSQLIEHSQRTEKEINELKLQKPQLNAVIEEKQRLELENADLNQKIIDQTTEVFTLNQSIAIFRVEIESLKKTTKKIVSPEVRKTKSNDLYVSQNQQLALEGFKSTPTRVIERTVESKHRRQSIHDSRRRLSDWEKFTDSGNQTENVNEMCACNELNEKLAALSREVRLKDCKINNMERLIKHNPLKPDLDHAKKLLADEQRKHGYTKSNLESLNSKNRKLENKIEVLSQNQAVAKVTADKANQAVDNSTVDKIEYELLEKRLNEMKRANRLLEDKVKELENNSKENVHKNTNIRQGAVEHENQMLKKKLQELEEKQSQTDDAKDFEKIKAEHEILKKKYDTTRRLCNLRNDDLTQLKAAVETLKEYATRIEAERDNKKENLEKMFIKYTTMKELCQFRLEKIHAYRARLGETPEVTTAENTSQPSAQPEN